MKWTEQTIGRALARQFFNRRHLVVLPNCTWPGHECDVLAVTQDLRLIDVEIKVSRSDLKADAKKDKWWRRDWPKWDAAAGCYRPAKPDERREWPQKVWKHYYVLPRDLWDVALFDCLPSERSGVLLLDVQRHNGLLVVHCERRATPCKDADRLTPADAVDIARLASLRMWDAYEKLEKVSA